MPDLLSLPEEIFCNISGFVHPQTVVDWACTCKTLFRCSSQALRTHKQRQSVFRVVHDRNPITIPSLLREPKKLWYVRSLEVWDQREKFQEWKSPDCFERNPYYDQSKEWSEQQHDYSHLNITFYDDEELERYRSTLSTLLHLEEPLVDKWMDLLRSGSDEPLKVLLMAMSPELTKVAFVDYHSWRLGEPLHPFEMLASTLRALAPLPSPEWPCFQNLKIVHVGISEIGEPDVHFNPHSREMACLFLLPAIEEIDSRVLDEDLEIDPEFHDRRRYKKYVWQWELGRSSCQKLSFSGSSPLRETVASFIGATHSLRYLGRVDYYEEIILALLQHSSHSLETVRFEEVNPYPGQWDNVVQHPLQNFQRLASIELPQIQLTDMSSYTRSQMEFYANGDVDLEKSSFGTTNRFNLIDFFPPTLQTLKITYSEYGIEEYEAFGLVHQLVALVNAKLFPRNGAFASLTEICLQELDVRLMKNRWKYNNRVDLDPWLGDLRWVCEKAKVKLHTELEDEEPSGHSYRCSFCWPSEWNDLDPRLLRR